MCHRQLLLVGGHCLDTSSSLGRNCLIPREGSTLALANAPLCSRWRVHDLFPGSGCVEKVFVWCCDTVKCPADVGNQDSLFR